MFTLKMPLLVKRWVAEQEALAAVEAALIFPVMLVMMIGIVDAGNAILANQKTVRASQVVADLIARGSQISQSDITEAIAAGRLAFEPLDAASYGVDIVSIRFDEEANGEIVWRQTVNMPGVDSPLTDADSLAAANEGAVMVSVQYVYEPLFGDFIMPQFTMNEVAFSRGRNSAVVNLATE